MKSCIKILICFLLMQNFVFGQSIDSVANRIVSNHLLTIKKYLDDPNSDSTLRRVSIIHFMTVLTGIASESDGNYIGQLAPTINDYTLWNRWLILNEENIFFDKKSRNIVLHKVVSLPDIK